MICSKKVPGSLQEVWKSLSIVDKLLPVFIILCIVIGMVLSVYVPSSRAAFEGSLVMNVSVPLVVGLIVMMVPPLCKVEWENLYMLIKRKYLKHILISLVVNWILCPFLMFGLAWLTLFDKKEYREGVIMIGLARCIAMVLIWNEISDGDNSLCAVLVLVNSMLQIVLYAPYQIFFCYVITGDTQSIDISVSYTAVAQSVGFFLGIPIGVGFLIRMGCLATIGRDRYEKRVLPFIGPWALIGLLYTIIVIFIGKGDSFLKEIGTSIRCFVPLLLYFPITFFGTFFAMRWISNREYKGESDGETDSLLCGCEDEKKSYPNKWSSQCSAKYTDTITHAFTAASNNFELSIAISVSLYGNGSPQAIAAVYGPLLEIPIMLFLCVVAKYVRIKFLWKDVKSKQNIEMTTCA